MEVKARLSRLRMSPPKVRLVSRVILGMSVAQAEAQLKFINKKASRPMLKLLESAVANAVNNFKLAKDNLYIKNIVVNEGLKLKRYRPRAMGRASLILKRSSAIDILLEEKVESKGIKKSEKQKIPSTRIRASKEDLKVVSPDEVKKELGKKSGSESISSEKKPMIKLKEIKDRFIRRSGEK